MKKMLFLLALPAMFLASCGDGNNGTDPNGTDSLANAGPDLSDMVSLETNMEEHGVDLTMMVPNSDKAEADPLVEYDDGRMITTVKVGERFQLVITDMEPDKAQFKRDLEGDLTFTNTIIEETDDMIIYESKAADMERTFFHLWMSKDIGGIIYQIEDNKAGEFTKVNIEEMVKSIRTIEGKVSA